MSNARELAQIPSTPSGRRNLITNGAMNVAQRGTSQTTTGYGSVDRWYVDNTADGGGQAADAPDDLEYSLKINPDSGNATARQAIELPAAGKGGVFRSGQNFTLSFWIKSDNAGESINIFIASSTSVIGTTTIHVNDTSTGLTTSTSWTKYTYTYTQTSDVGGSDTCYNIVPYVSAPSGAIYLTGIQLEVGSVATEFEHRSYGEELALCQRYFQYYKNPPIRGVVSTSTSASRLGAMLPVIMRANPSVTINQTGSSSFRLFDGSVTSTYSSLNASYLKTDKIEFDINVTGGSLTIGRPACLYDSTNTYESAFLIDAEL